MKEQKTNSGLPTKVRYCSECNLSNQQPTGTNEHFHTSKTVQNTIEFDDNGVCAACNFNKLKWNDKIDWKEREKELLELCGYKGSMLLQENMECLTQSLWVKYCKKTST